MHNRVFIREDILMPGEVYRLSKEESHHLIHVRRLSLGGMVQIVCASGKAYEGLITNETIPVEIKVLKEVSKISHNIEVFY